MGPGLPCDCAVNTAVLSRREPARHRETLSSLLLLIEKPIAIYVLTLDTESIPRGAAPAEPLLGWPSHLGPAAAGVRVLRLLQTHPWSSSGTGRGDQLVERWGTCTPESWSHMGLALFVYSVRRRRCGCPRWLEQLDSFCPVFLG